MLKFNILGRKIIKTEIVAVRNCTSYAPESDYVEKPEYPPIVEITPMAEQKRRKLEYYEQLKKLKTVEEKLLAVNVPRYYGWPTLLLKEGVIPYNYLPFVQHVTKTVFYETKRLPVYFDNDQIRMLVNRIKAQLEPLFIFEHFGKINNHEIRSKVDYEIELTNEEISNFRAKNLIRHLNRVITNNTALNYPHILLSQIDYEPRLEAFWRVAGFYPTKEDKHLRKKRRYPEKNMDDPIERCFQYYGYPALTLRNRLPLLPISSNNVSAPMISPKEECDLHNTKTELIAGNTSTEVMQTTNVLTETTQTEKQDADKIVEYPIEPYRYDAPTYFSIPRERVAAVTMPGFWPNDINQFGLLSYLCRGYLIDRPPSFGEVDFKEALHSQAILNSYSWLLGQACYQGFSTFYDVTYPFVTQTVVTDGRLFNFYLYQLNTTVLHDESNPLTNECYGTGTEELYHDITDKEVIGWNDEVLQKLLSFYLNVPSGRPDVNMNPYLGEEKLLAHIDDTEKRNWIHNKYRHITSRRNRYLQDPQIWEWEQIYKIEFNKRPLDPRRRFFEVEQDPLNDETFIDRRPRYIPKVLRHPDKSKLRYEDTYYPTCLPTYIDVV